MQKLMMPLVVLFLVVSGGWYLSYSPENPSEEELAENGANASITHNDFMIGSAELDIDGITADGRHEPIFRKGNWAF